MKSMLTVTIPVSTIERARQHIAEVAHQADLLEIRLDYLKNPDIEALKKLTADITLPYILTLRSKQHGGLFSGDETTRLHLIKTLLAAKPDYLDLEIDVEDRYIDEIHAQYPEVKLIRSCHDFKHTPEDLSAILERMRHPAMSVYKIITYANSSLDSLRMMNFVKQQSSQHHIVGHCMGEEGVFSRIAGAVMGNLWTYVAVDTESAVVSHQLTLSDYHNIYFLHKKNSDTKLFALLGDPVIYSLGHIFHNKNFDQHDINALYLKIKVSSEQLTSLFALIKTLPFFGFSVTTPLKQEVLPYVRNLSGLQAVNTLSVENGEISAINTDGLGTLDAIEEIVKVKDKKVLLLGAGGAAKAIAQAAHDRGADMTIANRTFANAEKIARLFPAKIIDFSVEDNTLYDIVINALTLNVFEQATFIDWLSHILQRQPLVMDVNYNRADNPLLSLCEKYNCQVIRGEKMFVNQALAQYRYWFNKQ
ncbi:MAG: shikimate dehydrogenase [Pseudomonadota bacterium]